MFNRFTKEAKAVVVGAEAEARALGAPSIEAEHLLLAYAKSDPAALASAGLDHDSLLAAIRSDFEGSLRAVGVSDETIRSAPPARPRRKPRFAASSKAALESAFVTAKSAGERRIEARHVAQGVLSAKRGTVPRALRSAGLEAGALREQL